MTTNDQMIPADKVRDLRDGTTPGPWILHPVPGHPGLRHISTGAVVGLNGIPECIPVHMDSKVGAANMTAIATVPAMLATIAGMREEWGVSLPDGQLVGVGWGTYETAKEDRDAWRRDGHDARIIRRYVTKQEEA